MALTILSHDLISLENGISAFSKLKKKQKKIYFVFFKSLSRFLLTNIPIFSPMTETPRTLNENSHKLEAGDRSGRISLLTVF